jgi:hypothetical protein
MQQPTCSGLGMWGGRGRRRRRVCTKKKAGAFGLPHLPPSQSHRSLPRPPPSSQARSSGGAGERAGGEEGSLSSFCSAHTPPVPTARVRPNRGRRRRRHSSPFALVSLAPGNSLLTPQFLHLELGWVSVARDPCEFGGLDPSWAPH